MPAGSSATNRDTATVRDTAAAAAAITRENWLMKMEQPLQDDCQCRQRQGQMREESSKDRRAKELNLYFSPLKHLANKKMKLRVGTSRSLDRLIASDQKGFVWLTHPLAPKHSKLP